MELEVFKKLPLGGVDRRSLVSLLKEKGRAAAEQMLKAQVAQMSKQGAKIADDAAVLILGGSNGITRSVAAQLALAEGVPVVGVHYDSAKMQIGVHHVAALEEAAKGKGVACTFFNKDATKDKTIEEVIAHLKDNYRAVHLINGIAAGATKRYEKHGPTKVRDLDVAFDPVLQIPDFGNPEAYRQLGLVEVETATEAEIERTNKFMGTSSLLWAKPLAEAGLLVKGESVVAFCDYDYPDDDPVYAMGPLAGAKILQRETMQQIAKDFGARCVRICYPAMPTTALGAIPGGTLMYALTGQILAEREELRSVDELGQDTMAMWLEPLPGEELRLDEAYQKTLPEFYRRRDAMTPEDIPQAFSALFSKD
jgi:enoyl-[acyl-carrier protein] reductase/trans-2-enoyl-CoA reductase (NAD+)